MIAVPAEHQQQTLVALSYGVVVLSIPVQRLIFGYLVKRWIPLRQRTDAVIVNANRLTPPVLT